MYIKKKKKNRASVSCESKKMNKKNIKRIIIQFVTKQSV